MKLLRSFPVLALPLLLAVARCSSFGAENIAPSSDAGPPEAATADAAILADAGPSGFCVPGDPSFCDDFERDVGDVAGRWMLNGSTQKALSISESLSTSPSHSLHAETPLGAGSGYLTRKISGGAGEIEIAFSMRFDGATRGAQFLNVTFGDSRSNVIFIGWTQATEPDSALVLSEQELPDAGGGVQHDMRIGTPPLGTFVRYRVLIDNRTKKARVLTDVEGLGAELSLKFSHALPSDVRIGLVYALPRLVTSTFWIDDVLVR